MGKRKRTICLDFDGVIHVTDESFSTPGVIPGEVSTGFFEWADAMVAAGWDLVISSCRFSEVGNVNHEAIFAVGEWLAAQREKWAAGDGIFCTTHPTSWATFAFSSTKPPAMVYIDDRGLRFEGSWETLTPEFLESLRPWNKPEKKVIA